jgi:signal transduction histidine kinase
VNPFNNAIKYTPADRDVSPRVRIKGCYAVLKVVDTGIGIPPSVRQFP